MTTLPPSVLGIALAMVAAVGFSISLVLARYSYDFGANPLTVLLIRFLLMALLTYAWCRLKRQSVLQNGRTLAACYLVGLFYFIGIGSYLNAVAFIPVSLAVLLFYTFPIITTLLAAFQARRPPKIGEIVALLLAFTGIVLALNVTLVELHPLGVGLALLAALGVSVNLQISERVLRKTGLAVYTFHMSIGALACVAIAILGTDSFSLPEPGTSGQVAFGIMLVAFIVAFLSVYTSVRLIGSVHLVMILNLEPVATILCAFVVLGETMSPQQGFGASLVIVAIVAAQAMRWHQQRMTVARAART